MGLDIASNALDEHVAAHYPLIRACLWNLPDAICADYGYCVDVMEHIPKERVEHVLYQIKSATRVGCFFKMSDGEAFSWEDKLREVWTVVNPLLHDGSGWFSVVN